MTKLKTAKLVVKYDGDCSPGFFICSSCPCLNQFTGECKTRNPRRRVRTAKRYLRRTRRKR